MKPSQVAQALRHCISVKRPVFIWGPPGVGKSDTVAQVAKAMGRDLSDVRLSLLDPVDLKGFPVPDMANRQMTWLPADFLPPMEVKKTVGKGKTAAETLVPNDTEGVLFLDELTSAPPAVQGAAYQLILNRKIGNYTLPIGWDIVAAGNREGDRSIVHRMPAALRNRFIHVEYEVNADEWSQWAVSSDIQTEIIAFLRFKSNLLHSFDPSADPRAFPTPRTWAFASDILKSNLPAAVELELLRGTVGDAAGELTAFMRVYKDLPTVDEVLMNPDKAALPNELSAKYAISTSLAAKASRDNFDVVMQYVNRLPTEFQVVFMRDSARRDDGVQKAQSYMKWCVKNHEVMT